MSNAFGWNRSTGVGSAIVALLTTSGLPSIANKTVNLTFDESAGKLSTVTFSVFKEYLAAKHIIFRMHIFYDS